MCLISVASMTGTMEEIIVAVTIAVIAVPIDAAITFGKIKFGCGYASYQPGVLFFHVGVFISCSI